MEVTGRRTHDGKDWEMVSRSFAQPIAARDLTQLLPSAPSGSHGRCNPDRGWLPAVGRKTRWRSKRERAREGRSRSCARLSGLNGWTVRDTYPKQ